MDNPENYTSSSTAAIDRTLSTPARRLSENFRCMKTTPLVISTTVRKSLTNFTIPKKFFKTEILTNGAREMEEDYYAPTDTADIFLEVFPKLAERRGILQKPGSKKTSTKDLFHANKVMVQHKSLEFILKQLDSKTVLKTPIHRTQFLGIGGTTAVTSAALASASGLSTFHNMYSRHCSNFDGSAYYYHIRDGFPVYINKVNRGPYCVYTAMYKWLISNKRLEKEARENPGFVKIHINFMELFKKPKLLFLVFVPNFVKMMFNIYIHKPANSDISQVVLHASRAHLIAKAIEKSLKLKDPLILRESPQHRACYAGLTTDYNIEKHFNWLNEFAPGKIEFEELSPESLHLGVNQLLQFPQDGCMAPEIFERLLDHVDKVETDARVIEITVDPERGVLATFEVANSERQYKVFADSAVIALGPSAKIVNENNQEITKTVMWAAGSTSVVMVAVELSKDTAEREIALEHSKKFTYFIDSVNQHWTPIESREIKDASGSEYLAFALQMTGGGNFPSRKTRVDTVYNLMFNFERIFKTDMPKGPNIYYDLIQTRGCPRAVTADNTIRFQVVGDRLCLAYGQGGIGMTTMLPNGELALRLVKTNRPKDIYEGTDPLVDLSFKSICD